GNAQIANVRQLFRKPLKISAAIVGAVGKRPHVYLVKHRVLVPLLARCGLLAGQFAQVAGYMGKRITHGPYLIQYPCPTAPKPAPRTDFYILMKLMGRFHSSLKIFCDMLFTLVFSETEMKPVYPAT